MRRASSSVVAPVVSARRRRPRRLLSGRALGRRTCVVTIDPARRLADALGAGEIGDLPHTVVGPWPGSLDAVMLDAKVTFDDLVQTYAANEEQATRILDNRVYRNLVSALSGTQEYMATEKLYELHASGAFDLVVVDTPPARNALDFLSAPERLAGFLDNRIFRMLLMPGRAYVRAVSLGTQLLLRTLAKVAGAEIVEDTVTFFQAFDGMEQGFRDRAAAVTALLGSPTTSFILIGAPHDEAMREARFFAEQLRSSGQRSVDALIMNRVLPNLGGPLALDGPPDGAWGNLVANFNDLAACARRETSTRRGGDGAGSTRRRSSRFRCCRPTCTTSPASPRSLTTCFRLHYRDSDGKDPPRERRSRRARRTAQRRRRR